MLEKRAYSRFSVQLSALYKTLGPSKDHFHVTVMDVGAEGMCLLSENLFDIGQEIEIVVHLDAEEKVSFRTQVAWLSRADKKQYKVGIRIVDGTTNDEVKFIRFYCEKMMSLSQELKKILLIDDEKDMVELLQIELERENYNVVHAYDGEDGFAKYLSERPDLIILDLAMPKMTGRQVCRKIRREEEDNKTPIVMLTAKSEETDRIIGKVVGAQKYITKPFEMQELLGAVQGLLSLSEWRRQEDGHVH